jgi:hypothetical protein
MNNFSTLFKNLAKLDETEINALSSDDLDRICNLAQNVALSDLGKDSNILITSWVNDNRPFYFDYFFALKPDWLHDTKDDKQVKLCVSIDLETRGKWYAHMVMDCEDGEIEEFGEKDFTPDELDEQDFPFHYMLSKIKEIYDRKVKEEPAKCSVELNRAKSIAEELLTPHVDAIKKICKERNIALFVDHSLDGTNCIRVVPNVMEAWDNEDGKTEIPLDDIPFIDLDLCSFNSDYDSFHRVK